MPQGKGTYGSKVGRPPKVNKKPTKKPNKKKTEKIRPFSAEKRSF